MNDAFGVGGFEGIGDLRGEGKDSIDGHSLASDETAEGLAFHVFHGDKRMAGLFADIVDGADVGMIEGGSGLGFALKTGKGALVSDDGEGKKLERDEAMEASVLRFVDDAHAASADFFDDAVVGDGLADERICAGHVCLDMLGGAKRQVNEGESLRCGVCEGW